MAPLAPNAAAIATAPSAVATVSAALAAIMAPTIAMTDTDTVAVHAVTMAPDAEHHYPRTGPGGVRRLTINQTVRAARSTWGVRRRVNLLPP